MSKEISSKAIQNRNELDLLFETPEQFEKRTAANRKKTPQPEKVAKKSSDRGGHLLTSAQRLKALSRGAKVQKSQKGDWTWVSNFSRKHEVSVPKGPFLQFASHATPPAPPAPATLVMWGARGVYPNNGERGFALVQGNYKAVGLNPLRGDTVASHGQFASRIPFINAKPVSFVGAKPSHGEPTQSNEKWKVRTNRPWGVPDENPLAMKIYQRNSKAEGS